MRLCRYHEFPAGIRGWRLGWSPAGRPLMSVYFFCFDRILVDTGQSHMAREVLGIAEENRVERIFLTHHHEDHSGNAALIRDRLGAGVFGHEETGRKMASPYRILPYQKYIWGATTPVGIEGLPGAAETALGPMVPVHAPGHSRDHTVYFLPDQGILFSGDLYLGDRIKYFRSDEDLGRQVASLKKISKLDFDILLCSHNPRLKQGRDHILAKLDFLENFYGSVVALYQKGCGEKEIFKGLGLREDQFTKWFCFGNVSMMNGVKSVIRHHRAVA